MPLRRFRLEAITDREESKAILRRIVPVGDDMAEPRLLSMRGGLSLEPKWEGGGEWALRWR
jgi:hypothetical protein